MFHFLFPPITIGLALLITIIETLRGRTGKELYRRASDFWLRIFAVNFVVGVATGIVMEFQFGTNWAGYSRFVGDIFGAPLAAEGVFAFFLESGFLGLLLFGRKKISSFVRWLAATMVWLGSTLSSLAIAALIAIMGQALYPFMVPSLGDLANSLTIRNASSTPLTLKVMLAIALAGMPFVVGYTIWIYRNFLSPVVLDEHSY